MNNPFIAKLTAISIATATLTSIGVSTNAFAADALNVTSIDYGCAGIVGCSAIAAGQPDSWFVNGTTTATSLNSGGSGQTLVGNSSATAPSGTGTFITGTGTSGGPDVYITSSNGNAGIEINNSGVQIFGPPLSGAGTSTNNFGNGGANSGTSSVTNNIGNGSTSSGTVNNTIGQSYAGGGTVTNSLGGGTGSSTTSIGSVSGNGSSTNNFGTTDDTTSTSTNNIGTGLGASTNNLGNTNTSTTIAMQAGNSSSNFANGISTTSVQAGGGVGGSILGSGTTSANSGTVLKGAANATYAVVNANGKITMQTDTGGDVAAQSSTSMTLTNGLGNTHGLIVNETQATLSGGTRSSSMTLNDNGATFSNPATGAPIQVHGVANGTAPTDAVNVRQMRSGVASASALAGLPALDTNKDFSIAIAGANYQGYQAAAVGLSARINKQLVVRAATTTSYNGGATNIGVGYSW